MTERSTANRPNIILIMTDQQRGDCLSCEGHPVLLTPSMDGIAAQGTRFRRAYSTCPVCIPARRSLLSGQFPQTHGLVGYAEGIEWHPAATLPGTLADAGYQSVLIGRSMHQHPGRKRYGYEQMTIFDRGAGDDYGDFLRRNSAGYDATSSGASWLGGGVMHNDWTARPFHLPEPMHFTNWVVDESLRFLHQRDPSCPLFLTVSFIAPHPPLQPPAFYFERYLRTGVPPPHIGDWALPPASAADCGGGDPVAPSKIDLRGEALLSARAGYYGLINHVDDQIRRLLNSVDGLPRLVGDNTVVLFTSDHGEMLGDHHQWRKQQGYEASARVPLLVRGPRSMGLAQNAVVDAPVCLEDIMPTCLDLAGLPIPASVEGRSLLPLLRGERPAWRDHLHLECADNFHAITDGQRKYVWLTKDGREQFFDLATDPNELRNLVADPAWRERAAAWRGLLIEKLKGRPEGFTDGERLIAGRPYRSALPHAGRKG
ncbi:MAG: arylsulfatase [Planctomycetota bacterium]|nr:arylsulfatase [Planctomycetota bacterium]